MTLLYYYSLPLSIFFLFVIFVIIIIIIIIRITGCRPYGFRKIIGVPYVRSFTYWRHMTNVLIFGNDHISNFFDGVYKRFPTESYIGYYEYFRPCLLIKNPKLIGRILAKDFRVFPACSRYSNSDDDNKPDPFYRNNIVNLRGVRWKMVRDRTEPIFSIVKSNEFYFESIEKCVRDLDDYIDNSSNNESSFNLNVKEPLTDYAIDVIGRALFGTDFNALKNPRSEYRAIARRIVSPCTFYDAIKKFVRLFLDPIILTSFKIKIVPEFVENFFANFWSSLVQLRETNDIVRDDFAQSMIDWSRQICNDRNGNDNDVNDSELRITSDLILANVYIFYVGGFSTTAVTFSFVFHELALNPDVQTKLREEINQTIDDYNGVVNYRTVYAMTYLDMVVSECLRLHGAVPFIQRVSEETYEIPDSSVVIPKGTTVTIPIYSIHKDPEYYPEPDKFIPERFMEENKAQRPPYTFLPFGAGPRICIARKLAILEMKLCLIRIIPKYAFSTCEKTITPIRLKPRSILRSANHDMTLLVTKLF